MYRYDNYTDSFVRIDGEPNTGSTTVRVGVPLKEAVTIKKFELTDECIDKIADAVVQKFADRKTEPQTETPKIRKRIDKPFRAVWLDDDHNEIGTPQTERVETMSCQECKWWFTDSLKHGGYCQSLLYNHECRYELQTERGE